MPTFTAAIQRGTTQDTMGLVIPPDVVTALGRGKRPPVTVTLGGYSYRSTVASMGGVYLVGVAKEHREHVDLDGRDAIEVTLALDTAPRDTPVPDDLAAALGDAGVADAFAALAPSKRKELVRQIETAKKPETRAKRVQKAVDAAVAGR